MKQLTITPDDALEVKRIVKSLDMALCLWDIQYHLFRTLRDQAGDLTGQEVYDKALELVNGYFDDNNINLNELIE